MIRRYFPIFLLLLSSLTVFGQPTGKGWSVAEVAEGVKYYKFAGRDALSKSRQVVHVTEVDLGEASLAVELTYSPTRIITSEKMADENVVAAMNAGYEVPSIYIRVDGINYSQMPDSTVMDTGVPNWKNEGAICSDGPRDIKFAYAGVRSGYAEQKALYDSLPYDGIISSAPVLVFDSVPVGALFSNPFYSKSYIKSLPYENPDRHQGVRHPRTAVATTSDGHLLLVVVDGRRSNAKGMTAKELTTFLVKHFNPDYALNLDGGGSSTLCIRGFGAPGTFVVNSPTDAAGERKVRTHIVVKKSY